MNIKTQLTDLIEGLYYSSESDYPYEVLEFGSMTEQEIKASIITGYDTGSPFETVDFDAFFNRISDNLRHSGDPESEQYIKRYKKLQQYIESHSSCALVWRFGRIEIGVYIIFFTRQGTAFGLKTTSIET